MYLFYVLYSLVWVISLPFLILRLWIRSLQYPPYRQRWLERLGFIPFHNAKPCIWIHTVSVGEFVAATALIKKLQSLYPNHAFLVTATTPAGSERVQAQFGSQIYHCYLPFDLPWIWRRFIHQMSIRLCIILETELWPNLYRSLSQHHIPIVLANARLSERSLKAYRFMEPLMHQMLQHIDLIAAQSPLFAKRFEKAGCEASKIHITGNLKFDQHIPAHAAEIATDLRHRLGSHRPIWIGASTHEHEEQILLEVHQRILNILPEALLIVVPRRPERFERVVSLCQKHFHTGRRSMPETLQPHIQVMIGDTMGELPVLYSTSDLAFIGGSLVPIGGHNALEAAAVGLPTAIGPHTFNCNEIVEALIEAKACTRISNPEELYEFVFQRFTQPERLHQESKNALQFMEQQRGAVDRHIELIQNIYPSS